MLDEHRHRKGEAHGREVETLLHAQGDGDEHHRPDGLGLEHQSGIHHQEGEDDVEDPERCIGGDAHRVEGRIDHRVGQVRGVEAAAEHVGTGREEHQVPGDVHVVPFHDADARNQGQDGADEGDDRLVNLVESALGDPQEEDDEEDAHGLPFLRRHLAHGGEFAFQAVDATLDLGHLLLLLHREEHVHAQDQAHHQNDHRHRPDGHQPLLVTEVAGAHEAGDEGNGQQVRAGARIEGVRADVDLEQVLDDEVAAEVVAVAAGSAVDGADDHEDREHDRRLHRRRGNEGRQHQVDYQEAPQHPLGALAELDDEGKGETFGELRLHEHRSEHEAQDVEPHHGVAQLGERVLLRGHVEQHDQQDEDEGSQVVRQGLRHPQDETRHEDGQHRIVGPDEPGQAQGVEPLLRRRGQQARVQIVDEADVAEPTDPDEGGDRQRTAQPGHPHLKLRLLHLGQFLYLVVAHVQRIERRLRHVICRHNVTSSSCKGSS